MSFWESAMQSNSLPIILTIFIAGAILNSLGFKKIGWFFTDGLWNFMFWGLVIMSVVAMILWVLGIID